MFGDDVAREARAHALAAWPEEACGVVSGGHYVPIENIAADRENGFEMPAETWLKFRPEAVIHSHNAKVHPHWPSKADMVSQIAANIPFGIVSCDGEVTTPILWWGDHCLDAPLTGRSFVPGVFDCYGLVRSWYWQERGIRLPDFPRSKSWWEEGENLLADHFEEAGFRTVDTSEAQPGDVFFMRLVSKVPCHSGILLEDGLCLHHLDGRLSRREPVGPWLKRVTHWVRYGS
ncbi:C40 family peptidase [Martelella lutilitoris]|uniref:C40 family peptidase n=1 Tax=Martelella lutilitoris TaxID=2583532 RepID=A0A7T7HMB6_9HYPH|nr:NlpC/P60 family protein [Martelella lutilitoris]QQM31739.1 C40 family peptidase [Martelella lutilitoris]